MKKSYIVDSTCNDMRIDRWFRHTIEKIPQGLIEKNLREGKIKLNKKKIKSSYRIKTNDKIDLFNLIFPDLRFFSIRLWGILPNICLIYRSIRISLYVDSTI